MINKTKAYLKRTCNNRRIRFNLVIILLIISLVYASSSYFYWQPIHETGDSTHYFRMSENIFSEDGLPFKYRILTPILASALPLKPQMRFFVFNFFILSFASILFYLYLCELGFDPLLSFIGCCLLILNPIITKGGILLIEPVMIFCLIAAFYSLLVDKKWIFFLAVFLGTINKEVTLILIPLYFIYTRKIFQTIFMSILPILAYVAIRLYFGGQDMFFKNQTLYVLKLNLTKIIPRILSIGQTFSFMWIIALFGYKKAPQFIKKCVPWLFVLPILFCMSVAIDRMAYYAFPILIPLVLQVLKDTISKKQ